MYSFSYLAQGSTMQQVAWNFHVGKSTVLVKETCEAIWDVMSSTHVKFPSTIEEWKKVAHDFEHI